MTTEKTAVTCDRVEITVLVDEQASDGLTAEHGLSLWIAAGDRRILFDTGQGAALMPNAQALGVPLEETDTIVLSHGHYDHTGGLADVLAVAPEAHLVLHPEALTARYSLGAGRTARPIGMPEAMQALVKRVNAEKVTWADRPVDLAPALGATGPIERWTSFEHTSGPFYLDERGRSPDPITDDQALWVATPAGLVVCVGCCHAGLVNTLNQIRQVSGIDQVCAVLGGFHLNRADDERLRRTVDALRPLTPEQLVPCHCTGQRAWDTLHQAFGDRVQTCHSGAVYRY